MPLLTDAEVVKNAIKLCTTDSLKKKILQPTLREDYDENFKKPEWDAEVEKEAFSLLGTLPPCFSLKQQDKERVVGAAFSIALRMLTWTEYMMGIFHFSYEFCFNLFKKEHYTPEGILDEWKVAEVLKNSRELNNRQAFQVACFYCFKDKIPSTFKALSKKEKTYFYDPDNPVRIKQLTLVKFWSYYLMGDIDKLRRHKSIDQYRLRCAINSGSIVAVRFCLESTGLVKRKNYIVDAGVELIKFRMIREIRSKTRGNVVDDMVAFRRKGFNPEEEFYTPNCHLADIFYFLISKMTDAQKSDMVEKFYDWCKGYRIISECPAHIKCYEYFLHWPYQRQFMDFVKFTLPYLKERSFGSILLDISSRIEPDIGFIWYRENSFCDYRKLLVEFWQYASEQVIRYIFSDKGVSIDDNYGDRRVVTFNEGKELIYHMYLHRNFTQEDKNIVEMIFSRANRFERKDVLLSQAGGMICDILLQKDQFDLIEEFAFLCLGDKDKAIDYSRKCGFIHVQEKCFDFIRKDKYDEAIEFMKYSTLEPKDIVNFKRGLAKCEEGKETCLDICLKDIAAADKFVKWCLSSKDEIDAYKRLLAFDKKGYYFVEALIVEGKIEIVNKFVNWCLNSVEHNVSNFKSLFVEKHGFSVMTKILFGNKDITLTGASAQKSEYTLADDFLRWGFPKKSDIAVFKKDYFRQNGGTIYTEFIRLNKCFEAAPLFSWLALPSEEVKKLRKWVLFESEATSAIFDDMMAADEKDERFEKCGGKRNAIEQLLKWCLIDKESLVEFRARYRCYGSDPVVKRVIRQLEDKFDDVENDSRNDSLKNKVIFMK